MNQLTIDFLSRRNDPETSKIAGRNAERFAAGHYARILAALKDAPGTIKDIASRTGLDHVAIARRMGELQTAKRVRLTGAERDGCREWGLRE